MVCVPLDVLVEMLELLRFLSLPQICGKHIDMKCEVECQVVDKSCSQILTSQAHFQTSVFQHDPLCVLWHQDHSGAIGTPPQPQTLPHNYSVCSNV